MKRYRAEIEGIVQGVGFRPFIYSLAVKFSLTGFVKNTAGGVYVEVQGEESACKAFFDEVITSAPEQANINNISISEISIKQESEFVIQTSISGEHNTLISPDIAVCDDCLRDVFDPKNRRYGYAFTNCTNCGPRFSIIEDIPYDRANTTMREFVQCESCQSEYDDPHNRRFHAQPNACEVCGPALRYSNGETGNSALQSAISDIKAGKIVAIKGLGGYHLCCDAFNDNAVTELRERKNREEKPFAVMVKDISTAEPYCYINNSEKALLTSSKKPIVLLKKRNRNMFQAASPNNSRLGVMLPYTPLHALIMQHFDCLVMTSANISDSPMFFEESPELFRIADGVLSHNRNIKRRVDDSVMTVVNNTPHFFRRARGYAPVPINIDCDKEILALGAQQKNTFCVTKQQKAFLSSHIGELDDIDTIQQYISEISSFCHLFGIKPEMVACDMHPDYFSTDYARTFDLDVLQVQHHYAHFASVLAENAVKENAIGFIFDGTGYGTDKTIWGGEMLFGQVNSAKRAGHLRRFPLLGGEAAIKQPWRIGLALLQIAFGGDMSSYFPEHEGEVKILLSACEKGINSPLTSSMGRLFDGIAAIIGLRTECSYEGQAAIELEQIIADEAIDSNYSFEIAYENDNMIFDWISLVRAVVADIKAGISKGNIAKKFHNVCVDLVVNAAKIARERYYTSAVALSGGVFMNEYLLKHCQYRLQANGFNCYVNVKVPANDGGISYGQAAVAANYEKDFELCVLRSREE